MKEPLGMPAGSVRAIITIAIVTFYLVYTGLLIYMKYALKIDVDLPIEFTALVSLVVGYYFGTRTNTNTVTANSAKVAPPEKYMPPTPSDAEVG